MFSVKCNRTTPQEAVKSGEGCSGEGKGTCKAPGMGMKADMPRDSVRSAGRDQKVDREAWDRTRSDPCGELLKPGRLPFTSVPLAAVWRMDSRG